MSAAYTKRQLARELACSSDDAYVVADRLGIPFDERHGVDRNGRPFVWRRYLRVMVDEFLLERARQAARRQAS